MMTTAQLLQAELAAQPVGRILLRTTAGRELVRWADGPTLTAGAAVLARHGYTDVQVRVQAADVTTPTGAPETLSRQYRPLTYLLWQLRGEDRGGTVQIRDCDLPAGRYEPAGPAEQVAATLVDGLIGRAPVPEIWLHRVDEALNEFGGLHGLRDVISMVLRPAG
jgi:hypothetical protein